jgi:hypothetical protein
MAKPLDRRLPRQEQGVEREECLGEEEAEEEE